MSIRLCNRLFALVALALASSLALAQVPGIPVQMTGNELMRGQTVAGSTLNLSANHLRNSAGYLLVAGGTTVTTPTDNRTLNLIAIGAITTWNVSLPNTEFDGGQFCVENATAAPLTSVTVTVAPGLQAQTLFLPYTAVTIPAQSRDCWVFTATTPTGTAGTWYRVD